MLEIRDHVRMIMKFRSQKFLSWSTTLLPKSAKDARKWKIQKQNSAVNVTSTSAPMASVDIAAMPIRIEKTHSRSESRLGKLELLKERLSKTLRLSTDSSLAKNFRKRTTQVELNSIKSETAS